MSNLELWEKVRACPKEAQKEIKGGRLSGMTDINPVWRLKTLTEQFGPCGFGWYYEITDKWLEHGDGETVAAFVQINLYVKQSEWSMPIIGIGGSMFVAKEKTGPYTSDEAYKMALTDALSVACKSLGVAADIYWAKGESKYPTNPKDDGQKKEVKKSELTEVDRKELERLNISIDKLGAYFQTKPEDLTHEQVSEAIKAKKKAIENKAKEAANGKVQ